MNERAFSHGMTVVHRADVGGGPRRRRLTMEHTVLHHGDELVHVLQHWDWRKRSVCSATNAGASGTVQ